MFVWVRLLQNSVEGSGRASPHGGAEEKPEIKRQAILDEICVRLVEGFRDRTTTTTTLDNPLFVKPFNVSRFVDGSRRRDRTHATTDFLQIWIYDGQLAQQTTVKEKNLNRHTHTRPTRLIAPLLSLLCHCRKPARSLQICNQPAAAFVLVAPSQPSPIRIYTQGQDTDRRLRIAAFIIRQHGYLSQW
jgi:hypothetical protein